MMRKDVPHIVTAGAVGAIAGAATFLLFVFLSGAARADEPRWTGCYVGAAAGYAASTTDVGLDVDGVGTLASVNGIGADGATGTLTAGCDVRKDRVVLGVWGDYTWHDATWDVSDPGAGNIASLDLDRQWAIGGRAGVLVTPGTLVYGLVGYTRAELGDLDVPALAVSFPTSSLDGWIVGGGAELALDRGFFLDLRYTYSDFNSSSIDIADPISIGLDTQIHAARVGLTYKFGFDKSPIEASLLSP